MVRLASVVDDRLTNAVREIGRHFGDRLLGVVLFGSRAKPAPRADADWDLMLVLGDDEPLRRALYREWEESIADRLKGLAPEASPHFVHLPPDDSDPSSLWLEVALASRIVSDPTGCIERYLRRTRELLDAHRYERLAVHGLPYWRRTA
jgi:predicted nucleotidyltransferase